MPTERAIAVAERLWNASTLDFRCIDDDITNAAAELIDEIWSVQVQQPETQLLQLVVAAMNEAAIAGKMSQLKLSFTPQGTEAQVEVRVLVIPEHVTEG